MSDTSISTNILKSKTILKSENQICAKPASIKEILLKFKVKTISKNIEKNIMYSKKKVPNGKKTKKKKIFVRNLLNMMFLYEL